MKLPVIQMNVRSVNRAENRITLTISKTQCPEPDQMIAGNLQENVSTSHNLLRCKNDPFY